MSALQCPACGAEMSLDVALTHEALRRATFSLLQQSLPLGAMVMRYVALFRPAKNRMSPDRMAKLVELLLPDLQRQAISHKGRNWKVTHDGWRMGFESVLEKAANGKLTLPLENHRYLYTVLCGMADQLEAEEERAIEQARRTERPAGPVAGPVPVALAAANAAPIPDHVRAQMAALRRGQSIKKGEPC